MSKKLIYIMWFMGLATFMFVVYSSVTFERKPLIKIPGNHAVTEVADNPYLIKDVIQNTVEVPIIDSSVCKDNLDGYIYFQVGG